MHELTGKKAPQFSLSDQEGKTHALGSYLGKWVVLYFYPKDMTPGCTVEACSFRDANADLKKLGAVVLGVSMDSAKRHEKFSNLYKLNFPLLADEEGSVVRAYGSYGKKKFMGRTFDGILRNTYLINPEGVIEKVYEGVKVKDHTKEVVEDLQKLTGAE